MSTALVVTIRLVERCFCRKSRYVHGVHFISPFGWSGLTVIVRRWPGDARLSTIDNRISWDVPKENPWVSHPGCFAVVMGLRSLRVHRLVFEHTSTLTGAVPPSWSASLASTLVIREVLSLRCQVDCTNHLCGGIDRMSTGLVVTARLVERCFCRKSRYVHGLHLIFPFGLLGLTVIDCRICAKARSASIAIQCAFLFHRILRGSLLVWGQFRHIRSQATYIWCTRCGP
jgi:hypothetical protein